MGTRLGLSGTSRTFAVATRATAFVAAGVAAAALSSSVAESDAVLASAGAGAGSFAGASIARGAVDSLGRGIPALTAASIHGGALSSVGSGVLTGRSTSGATALSLGGTPGKRKTPSAHTASSARLWFVNETLGINLGVSDFSERHFFLVDSLGIDFQTTAFYGSSAFISAGQGAASFASASTREAVLSASGISTPDLAGAGLIVQSADIAFEGVGSVTFQGTEAGTVFGAGILASIGASGVGFGGASAHESATAISGSSGVGFGGAAIFSGALGIDGAAGVSFFSSDNTQWSISGLGAAAFSATTTRAGAFVSSGAGFLGFVSDAQGITPEESAPRQRTFAVGRVNRIGSAKRRNRLQ